MFKNWKITREEYTRSYILRYYIPHLFRHLKFNLERGLYKIFKYKHKHSFKKSILGCHICRKSRVDIDREILL